MPATLKLRWYNRAMPTRYFIPTGPARTESMARNSRFIATIDHTPTVDAAKALVVSVRAAFPDATHHVHGYVVGYGASVMEGMSDDGEPSGTAGRPVLAVVRGSGLGDLCVVVTRYFGGTLLGTGGLVKAYGDAAKSVLAVVGRVEKIEQISVALTVPYSAYDSAKLWIAAHHGVVNDETFAADVRLALTLPVDDLAAFRATVQDRTNGQVLVEEA